MTEPKGLEAAVEALVDWLDDQCDVHAPICRMNQRTSDEVMEGRWPKCSCGLDERLGAVQAALAARGGQGAVAMLRRAASKAVGFLASRGLVGGEGSPFADLNIALAAFEEAAAPQAAGPLKECDQCGRTFPADWEGSCFNAQGDDDCDGTVRTPEANRAYREGREHEKQAAGPDVAQAARDLLEASYALHACILADMAWAGEGPCPDGMAKWNAGYWIQRVHALDSALAGSPHAKAEQDVTGLLTALRMAMAWIDTTDPIGHSDWMKCHAIAVKAEDDRTHAKARGEGGAVKPVGLDAGLALHLRAAQQAEREAIIAAVDRWMQEDMGTPGTWAELKGRILRGELTGGTQ